jgi:hypothetical protein
MILLLQNTYFLGAKFLEFNSCILKRDMNDYPIIMICTFGICKVWYNTLILTCLYLKYVTIHQVGSLAFVREGGTQLTVPHSRLPGFWGLVYLLLILKFLNSGSWSFGSFTENNQQSKQITKKNLQGIYNRLKKGSTQNQHSR